MKLFTGLAALGLAAVGALAAAPAHACSCSPPPPACEALWHTSVVFSGEVTAMADQPGHAQLVTFKVDETFRGQVKGTVMVRGGGVCGALFAPGKKYLVYAGGQPPLSASLCSRTRLLAEAGEDLAYLRNPPKREKSVVDGTVRVDADDEREGAPRANVTIRARGTPSSARTDSQGRFHLELPVGSYTLDVDDPALRILHGRLPMVELPDAAACARRNILVVWNGRIRGTLLDHTGAPAPNVEVSAHARGKTRQKWRLDARSDAAGRYEIPEVPPGTWAIAVSDPEDGGPDERQPIPTTYYPGTAAPDKAKVLTTTRGGLADRIDFRLPKPLSVHTISGVVRRAGKPVAKVNVRLANQTWPRSTGVETDGNGRYTFKEVAGAELVVTVCLDGVTPQNYQEMCRDKKLKIAGDQVLDLELPQ